MPDERRQFHILYRDFLFRILDLELLASRGEAQRLLAQFAALLAAFSLTFAIYFVPRYGLSTLPFAEIGRLGWVDQDLLIATTMAIAGMFTVLAWNNVLPDRRDCLILGLLPVRTRTVFLAKVAALGTALGVAVTALNVFTGLAYPFAIAPPGGGTVGVLRAFGAYWATMFAAALLVCCALLAIQGIAANLLSYRLFLKLSSPTFALRMNFPAESGGGEPQVFLHQRNISGIACSADLPSMQGKKSMAFCTGHVLAMPPADEGR